VSRESRRMERQQENQATEERPVAEEPRPQTAPSGPSGPPRKRIGPGQFLREVRGELRRVAWPSRRELLSYSLVVLVTVALLTLYVFGLDQAFGQLVFLIFG
jgi:preprotein translocase subunit SecE